MLFSLAVLRRLYPKTADYRYWRQFNPRPAAKAWRRYNPAPLQGIPK